MGLLSSLRRKMREEGYVGFNSAKKPISYKSIAELEEEARQMAEVILPPGLPPYGFTVHTQLFMEKTTSPIFLEARCFRNTNGGILSAATISESLTNEPLIAVYLFKITHASELRRIVDNHAEEIDEGIEILDNGHNGDVQPRCHMEKSCVAAKPLCAL